MHSPKEFAQKGKKESLVSGLFFGLVLSMVFYNLFIYFSTKVLAYLYYVFYVLFYGVMLFILQGFGQMFLPQIHFGFPIMVWPFCWLRFIIFNSFYN